MKFFKGSILLFAFLVPGIFLFFGFEFKEFGEFGWNILFLIMLIRPLSQVFPNLQLSRIVPLRKELGILSSMLILTHGMGYFFTYELNFFNELKNSFYWELDKMFIWGLMGASFAFLLLITSNVLAMRLLKKWWKTLHYSAYLMFFFGGIHVFLGSGMQEFTVIFQVLLVLVFWLGAKFNLKINIPEKLKNFYETIFN